MIGEALHEKGKDGARRAKLWLEATTRVSHSWLNTDAGIGERCQFKWPFGGRSFSFDIGGLLRGPDFDGHSFLAECKKYSTVGNQPVEYSEYLAKCYVAYQDHPKWADHFMWITWHPFNINRWANLCSEETIEKGVIDQRQRVFGTDDESQAKACIHGDVVKSVADRLWVVVLSDKQEKLVIPREHLALIRHHEVNKGTAS
jgi:hypothetical protein